ncbi:UvrD-helicase domain-containing protein [Membranicola marinus]|uniref:DNA 3'-5' helicase n=1 Tax=Membranihabitans marinus TaxID=1227546 RepID=A0A953HR34_9BACT|nr:UvrD-helicase domain-containing protein [Membranihabitans marinus]MBY5959348.1 UvrD-helicase domain-containing protein [Membranihabitans marinus]
MYIRLEMELTQEQQAIINSTGNIKINAIAGSGKTTTIIEYARARPRSSRILYLAFNKSVKLEAIRKFGAKGLNNVKVETAHSLAYKYIVFKYNYKVRPYGYKIHEIADLLGLKGNREKHTEYVIANHILKFISYFCNSRERRVKDLNYLEIVSDARARTFVKTFYKYIERETRRLLAKMDRGEIEITHDFYLKKFQLSRPQLPYDYILFDEGQDASGAMLDVFVKQNATKVIVGDTHQQIYSWRFAVNSLEKTDFKNFYLSTSFRFSQDIANLAGSVLEWKKQIGQNPTLKIKGKGVSGKVKTKAIIARTNLGLLLKAIEFVKDKKNGRKIYFEGNIHSYTYADEGASLYDVLNLYKFKRKLIRDKLIKKMANLDELEDYIEKTEDAQLAMMVDIVKEYGDQIPRLLNEIKERHVDDNQKEKADMVFSTVHRCKGMEYDSVHIVGDFVSEEKLEKQIAAIARETAPRGNGSTQKNTGGPGSGQVSTPNSVFTENTNDRANLKYARLNEEINLLYVAITRTKSELFIPEDYVPVDFPPSTAIKILKDEPEEALSRPNNTRQQADFKKRTRQSTFAYRKGEKSENDGPGYAEKGKYASRRGANRPWTKKLDNELTKRYYDGEDIHALASHFGRTTGAIRLRVIKLDLETRF